MIRKTVHIKLGDKLTLKDYVKLKLWLSHEKENGDKEANLQSFIEQAMADRCILLGIIDKNENLQRRN